ncbi:MAG: winged helix DNA-binding domain-containing protein [Acidobacteria bacterium]|nr:winged helix DNA-binding domain-containing protein [Acidobacteriota bacterium]
MARDVAAWAGYAGIAKVVEGMRGELVEYQDAQGRTLFDVAEGRIVEGKMPVPVRFVAEYNNLVLGHANRSRVLPDEHRKKVLLTAGRVMATVLIDGFVGGVWKVEKEKKTTRIRVELFAEPTAKLRKQVLAEAERLAAFCEAGEVAIQ